MKKLVQISGRNHLVLIHQLKHNPDQVMPVLWLFSEGGAEAFPPLIDYFVARSNYTLSWKRRAARAIGLFYDFCLTYRFDERNSLLNVHYATLKAF